MGRGRFAYRLVFDLERVAAAARGNDVWVVDRKAALEAVDEVDLGAAQIRGAVRIDDHRNAVREELVIAFLRRVVEAECILEPVAATALDGNAKHADGALRLFGHEFLDLRRGSLGERDERRRAFGELHEADSSSVLSRRRLPQEPKV